ncbi:MAG: hypothetical protein ACRD43_09880, partial [Pyrinomonadaceae bacterium]
MMDDAEITAIVSQYAMHGWTLRRVLLSDELRKKFHGGDDRFGSAEIIYSDINALWFSRPSRPNAETWELRRLGVPAYALDAFLNSEMDAAQQDEVLRNAEERLRDNLSN